MPHSKPTSMPPAECHNSNSEIAWRIQKTQPVTAGRFFLNNGSFGQHTAGCRDETICIVVRPRGEKGAHTMRRVGEGTEELCALWVWGGGQRAGGRSEKRKSLQSQTLHRWTPLLLDSFPRMVIDYSWLVTTSKCNVITVLCPLSFSLSRCTSETVMNRAWLVTYKPCYHMTCRLKNNLITLFMLQN